MTTNCVYKTIYTGGIDAYQSAITNKFNVVISLIQVDKLPSLIHHKIAPLPMELPGDYKDTALEIVKLLDLSMEKQWKVLIHCYQGQVRSPGVALAYGKLRDPKNAPKQTSFSLTYFKKYLAN